ncbi:MAG: hypothetical protein JW741_29825 [Sedimentisphaerales bacterium]|nr:hypothetical protein [Sedimentisphaerales bacterium]
MTRREFTVRLASCASLVAAGFRGLARAVLPRRFVRAARRDKYPGTLVPMPDVREEGKWSG